MRLELRGDLYWLMGDGTEGLCYGLWLDLASPVNVLVRDGQGWRPLCWPQSAAALARGLADGRARLRAPRGTWLPWMR